MRSAVVFAVVALVSTALGCSKTELLPPDQTKSDTAALAKNESEACGKAKTVKNYGDKIKGTDVVDVAKVLDDPDKFADKPILVQGRVRAACTAKGCWMELAPSMEKEAPGSRVTFKDYGFFVPTTSAGKVACVEGLVSTKRVPADEVKHMEGEGGRFTKKMSDGSAREVRIVATGVEMWDAT